MSPLPWSTNESGSGSALEGMRRWLRRAPSLQEAAQHSTKDAQRAAVILAHGYRALDLMERAEAADDPLVRAARKIHPDSALPLLPDSP